MQCLTELDLALALKNFDIQNVDFETVWDYSMIRQKQKMPPSENFINWVKQCLSE